MLDLFRLLFGVIGVIIGGAIWLALSIIGTVILWPLYILVALVQCLWRVFDKDTDWCDNFQEWIFAYYGFCALFVYFPLEIFL